MDKLIDAALDVFDRSILILGPLLLVFGWVLVCVVGYLFYSTPFMSLERHSLPIVIAVDLIGLWLWFNTLFNWFLCFKTSPGFPPTQPPARLRHSTEETDLCQKCESFKPPRAHHCHVCQRCVLAMDHHCPWMANCIGFYSYRYFVLTLIYLTVGCVFVATIAAVEFGIPANLLYGAGSISHPVFFVFFLSTCAGCAVSLLLVWHIYLILSGQTTIEFYQRRMVNPVRKTRARRSWFSCWIFQAQSALVSNDYDLGPTENWSRVFGEGSLPFNWAMPSFKQPPGDGIIWKDCRSLVSMV